MYRLTVPIYLASSVLYAGSDMQEIGNRFAIDRTKVSIAAFALFAEGRDFVSQAERDGGGKVYALGWEQKLGWTWRRPFGMGPIKGSRSAPSVLRGRGFL